MKNTIYTVADRLLKLDLKSKYWGMDNLGGEKLKFYGELRVSYIAKLKEHAFEIGADYDTVMNEIHEVENNLLHLVHMWKEEEPNEIQIV